MPSVGSCSTRLAGRSEADGVGVVELQGVEAPERAVAPARYELLALLQLADVATTWILLRFADGVTEGNPIVDLFIRRVGLAESLLFLLVVKLAVVHTLWRKGTGVRFLSALYAAVVFNNVLALAIVLT